MAAAPLDFVSPLPTSMFRPRTEPRLVEAVTGGRAAPGGQKSSQVGGCRRDLSTGHLDTAGSRDQLRSFRTHLVAQSTQLGYVTSSALSQPIWWDIHSSRGSLFMCR
ncbi:hypothetical protein RRG08_010089 [Elysia crispata]|uniref:Uncharacterized protein n=1 Tax=Elysia crispata TaxID=231223 RepID=A0AAE1DSB5_9GAST|nr:hypothetical protein RRG08_010089 [Elysia crispata]